jgi:hypothetical protein
MRLRNTLILVVMVAILAGYFFFIEQPRHRRSREMARTELDVAAFGPSDAAALTIARPDVTLEFVRRQGRWWMTSPLTDRADDGAVNRLLGVLSDAEIARDLGPQADLAPFGLGDTAVDITVLSANGEKLAELDVGNLTVDKEYAYARLPGGGVILVPTGIRRYARGEIDSYRYDRVVEFQLAAVASFTVRGPDRSMTWRRTSEGEWQTEEHGRTIEGHKATIEEILRRLRAMRVREFVPEAEVPVVEPFDAPARSVSVVMDDGSAETVRVGRRMESLVYAGARLGEGAGERIALTDTSILDIFEPTVFDLRDRHVLRFDRAKLEKIVLESPDAQVTVVRPGEEWGYPNPSMGRIDQSKVGRILAAISDLEYTGIVDENPSSAPSYGLSNPDVRLTIFGESGVPLDQLVARRSDADPEVYVVSSRSAGMVVKVVEGDLDAVVDLFENLRQP